jgi:hypothetical protein
MRAGRPGKRGIGDKIAREIEAAFGKEHGWLDERHPPRGLQEHELMPEKDGTLVLREEPAEFPVRSGTQTIDVLDVHAAMTPPGGGLGIPMPERETVIDSIRVPNEWVRENLPHITSPKNLRIITGYGDSMLETYNHGDPLIVDIGVLEMRIDAIYVFALHNELYIKRIQRLPGGAIKVISDNRAKYDPFTVEAADRADIHTLARVVCAWNLRKL